MARIAVLAAALSAVAASSWGGRLAAQSADAPRLSVEPRIVAQVDGRAALRIATGGTVPPKAFVNLRGLPPGVGLSDGYAIGPGAWAIPLDALPTLQVYVPSGADGESVITISLVSADGELIAIAKSTLVIGPPETTALPAPTLPPSVASGSGEPGSIEAEALLKRGIDAMQGGRVELARIFYLRAAEQGLAAAALRLGATYDPEELARLQLRGTMPDVALARKWYERARQLGAPDAGERLARLGS